MKTITLGSFFLFLSGINLYFPNVGNDVDVWRIGCSIVAFTLGWLLIIKGVNEISD